MPKPSFIFSDSRVRCTFRISYAMYGIFYTPPAITEFFRHSPILPRPPQAPSPSRAGKTFVSSWNIGSTPLSGRGPLRIAPVSPEPEPRWCVDKQTGHQDPRQCLDPGRLLQKTSVTRSDRSFRNRNPSSIAFCPTRFVDQNRDMADPCVASDPADLYGVKG